MATAICRFSRAQTGGPADSLLQHPSSSIVSQSNAMSSRFQFQAVIPFEAHKRAAADEKNRRLQTQAPIDSPSRVVEIQCYRATEFFSFPGPEQATDFQVMSPPITAVSAVHFTATPVHRIMRAPFIASSTYEYVVPGLASASPPPPPPFR